MIKEIVENIEKLESVKTPTSEFKRQSGTIDRNIKMLMQDWKRVNKIYKSKIAKNPESWAGAGHGSELGELVVQTSELADFLKRLK